MRCLRWRRVQHEITFFENPGHHIECLERLLPEPLRIEVAFERIDTPLKPTWWNKPQYPSPLCSLLYRTSTTNTNGDVKVWRRWPSKACLFDSKRNGIVVLQSPILKGRSVWCLVHRKYGWCSGGASSTGRREQISAMSSLMKGLDHLRFPNLDFPI